MKKSYNVLRQCVSATLLSNERYERLNTELVIAFPLLRMKRAGKQSSIIWLVRQTLYHPWDRNISFSARRFSSPPWHSTNSFHSMLHHSRRHICHFVSSSFPPQRPPTWDSRRFSLSPTSVSRPPYLQFIRLLLLPILRPVNKTVRLFLPAIFRFPILPLLLQFCSGW